LKGSASSRPAIEDFNSTYTDEIVSHPTLVAQHVCRCVRKSFSARGRSNHLHQPRGLAWQNLQESSKRLGRFDFFPLSGSRGGQYKIEHFPPFIPASQLSTCLLWRILTTQHCSSSSLQKQFAPFPSSCRNSNDGPWKRRTMRPRLTKRYHWIL
jgi:hypothetical protein